MAKKMCVVCNRGLNIFTAKTIISDGIVCDKCLMEANIMEITNPRTYDTDAIKSLISEREKIIQMFSATKEIGGHIKVDEGNGLFAVDNKIFGYNNLLSYELLENGEAIVKGGLGSAVVGGLLFGGVGAIVGGATGGRTARGVCASMKLRITLKNCHCDMIYVYFITSEIRKDTFTYKKAQDSAQRCMAALDIIMNANRAQKTSTLSYSEADELVKFKNLLDSGAISQEEYDAKKKQLLGL